MQQKQTLFLQIFGLVAFIEQKENDNNDNFCKIHRGLYIASALINAIKTKYSFCKFSASRPVSSKEKTITMTIYVKSMVVFTLLRHLFPLPCGAGSTVPARGSTQVLLYLFPGMLRLWHFLYSVGPHPVSSRHIYPLLFRGHSWRVRLAKQETLTTPGHLVSPLVCRVPWMPSVVLYCWCYSDIASVLLYFTYISL